MWQLFSILALFSSSLENSLDKMATIHKNQPDRLVMTFFRVSICMTLIGILGMFGFGGQLQWLPDWRIIAFWTLSMLNSFLYTYILGKVEVTSIATIAYLGPVGYLLVDIQILNSGLSYLQVLWIFFLIAWGIGFSIEGNTKRFKKEITIKVLFVFLFWLIYNGAQSYFFKYMHQIEQVTASTFFTNLWFYSSVTLLILLVIMGKVSELFTNVSWSFAKRSIISKACSAGKTLFSAESLSLASVSQVTAMAAFEPIMLLFTAFIFQKILRIHLNERLDFSNFVWKISMVVLLIAWGLLVR